MQECGDEGEGLNRADGGLPQVARVGGRDAVGSCRGLQTWSNKHEGWGGAVASRQERAEMRGGGEAFGSCCKLPKNVKIKRRGADVASGGELT